MLLLVLKKIPLQFWSVNSVFLSMGMKTKVIQDVPRINLSYFYFQVFRVLIFPFLIL